jgi:hypothetical protein
MKRDSIVDQRNGDFNYPLVINLWEVVKWDLCSKNGGINLQLFLDYTCN